jgi:hypothetical protein
MPIADTGLRNGWRFVMSDSYIIEVSSRAAGLVVRDGGKFRFFAASSEFAGLEGQSFSNPREAEKAAMRQADLRKEKSRSSM